MLITVKMFKPSPSILFCTFWILWNGATLAQQRCNSCVTEECQWRDRSATVAWQRGANWEVYHVSPPLPPQQAPPCCRHRLRLQCRCIRPSNKMTDKTPQSALWTGDWRRDGAWPIPWRWWGKAEMPIHSIKCRRSHCSMSIWHHQKMCHRQCIPLVWGRDQNPRDNGAMRMRVFIKILDIIREGTIAVPIKAETSVIGKNSYYNAPVMLQWCSSCATMVHQHCASCARVVLQWCDNTLMMLRFKDNLVLTPSSWAWTITSNTDNHLIFKNDFSKHHGSYFLLIKVSELR